LAKKTKIQAAKILTLVSIIQFLSLKFIFYALQMLKKRKPNLPFVIKILVINNL